jgi:uncharacterized protein
MNEWWLLVCFAMLLIGVTKSGFGSGVGLMIVPLTTIGMAHADPTHGSQATLGLMLPLLVIGDLLAVWQYRRLFSMDIVKHLMPGTLVGVVLGGLMLWWFHSYASMVGALMRIEIGLESIIMVAIWWWRNVRGMQKNLMPEPWRSHVTGSFAAVSSTLAHAAGPVISMYLLPLKLNRQLYVGTCAIYFFILNTAKLPAYYLANQFQYARLGFTMKFLPLVVVGAVLGLWLNHHIDEKLFVKIVYLVTFLLGFYVLIEGVWLLAHPVVA